MRVYIRFISSIFFKSLIFVFFVMFSLVFILNLLTELEFFKDENVTIGFTLFLSLLNSPALMFEMFPFILLITIQLLFIKLFENKEIEIFKYSGLKNSSIFVILSILSFSIGLLIIVLFYNFSSNLKNMYLEFKSPYATDGKYLAVITKNGLWIKDKINQNTLIINSEKIEDNYLIENFISEFDENFISTRNITSKKIDITNNVWKIYDAKIFINNEYKYAEQLNLSTNFDYRRIISLYSNLSSLNIHELFELRKNYKKLNFSSTEVDLQILKIFSFPFYLLLMTIFSASIMLRIKQLSGVTTKIFLGLFFSVIIYYLSNFSYALGTSERAPMVIAVFLPIFILSIINIILFKKINEK